ncbi:hypothetical protein QBC32DRAFT_383167, partial [Pseudoneurospora amorphoporcata]
MQPFSRVRHSQPLRPLDLDTLSQTTAWKSHGQQVKLKVMDALTDMSGVELSTAEIDAVVALLMLRRHDSSACRLLSSSSPSIQVTGDGKGAASRSVRKKVITTTRECPRNKKIVDIQGKVVVSPVSQDPDGRSSCQTFACCSGSGPGTGKSNTTQYQAESIKAPSAPSTVSQLPHSQISKAGHPKGSKLYPQSRVAKKRKCLPNSSQPPHLASTPPPSTRKANVIDASSTNTTPQETQHKTSTTLHPQTSTNQEAPASPIKPTLILTAAPTSQRQDQSQTEPQLPPPSRSYSKQPQHLPPSHLRIATSAPTATTSIPAETTPTTNLTTTKPPKKKKKYGTAYEVSRARQIQATGVPRLPGPCHSCARRQRQLDEVAAAVAERLTGTDPGLGTIAGMGRFARPQRGDEFLPCTVLSNGNGDGTGPTPCARCKSIKMKCEG